MIKKLNFVYLVVLILVFILIFISIDFALSKPLEIRKVDVSFTIDNKSSFNLNKTALTFGKIVPGDSVIRKISLQNPYNFNVNVRIFASDEVKDFLSFDDSFKIEKNSTIIMPITIVAYENADFGYYNGSLFIEIQRIWLIGLPFVQNSLSGEFE